MATQSSTKPYLLRAIYDWAEDNGLTPQVLVEVDIEGVIVPLDHVVDGQIVLNISSSAVQMHEMSADCIHFSARFNSVEKEIYIPLQAVQAIFARENAKGIFFEQLEAESESEPTEQSDVEPLNKKTKTRDARSHLKIIK